jgi:hypothetical protein
MVGAPHLAYSFDLQRHKLRSSHFTIGLRSPHVVESFETGENVPLESQHSLVLRLTGSDRARGLEREVPQIFAIVC